MSKMSCTDNAKVSDSGYTNTCANSQSQRSSGSSLSRNSNRSHNSGYCGGLPSTFGSSNEALPQPISKKKKKVHSKKSKTLTTLCSDTTPAPKGAGQQTETDLYTIVPNNVSDQSLQQSGTVELMDATDSSKHNDNPIFTTPQKRLGCQTNPLDNTSPNVNKEEFGAIVSLHDGLVLHSTASFATLLGYSKNAWVGHSFIDSIHPKDKTTFADKLASSAILPIGERDNGLTGRQTSLYCCLRRHSELDSNKNIDMEINNDTAANYIPFHLHLEHKQHRNFDNNEKSQKMFLIITAQLVFSAYKVPEETIVSSIFSTRHTATGHLSHVDDDVVQYFGYLPQDMLGCSQFNYYHPADMPFIKDIYETVIRLEGSSFISKPYRFISQNGGDVILETEWSSFINPWEKKLKFIVGHHKVLRGPKNPDVFQPADISQFESLANISEAVMTQSKLIRNDICDLLAKEIPKSTSVFNLSSHSNDLPTFIKNSIFEVEGTTSTATTTITSTVTTAMTTTTMTTMAATKMPMVIADDRSISEHDSMKLGEISPHHEYCDSKSSSETPPSYNQLNYNEKIERFFNSKPLLTSVDNSNEENVNLTAPNNDDISKISSNHTPLARNILNNDSGGNGSNENLSNGSNNQTSSTSRDNSVNGDSNSLALENFKLMTLTETVLNKHNQDMEKLMVKKHKERRTDIKNSKLNKDMRVMLIGQEEATNKQHTMPCQTRGVKRSNSQNREDKFYKMAKYDETMKNYDEGKNSDATGRKIINDNALTDNSRPNINMWPQITVTHPLYPSARDATEYPPVPYILPVYNIPTLQIRENAMNPITSQQDSHQFLSLPVQSVRSNSYAPYATLSSSTSMIYPSPMILEVSIGTEQNDSGEKLNDTHLSAETIVNCKRPASQVTSNRAEPGSVMATSESSKKPLSPGGHFSSCVSIDDDCSGVVGLPRPIDSETPLHQIDSSFEDSSDSSFYGNFLNTSSGSSCSLDQLFTPNIPERYVTRRHEAVPTERRNFSMVNELKANFELQTARRTASTQQNHGVNKGDGGVLLRQPGQMIRISSPWLTDVEMTPEIIYQYQMSPKILAEVLKADMDTLKHLHQPLLVNDQLDQLYLDLELAGFSAKLILDESN